MQSVVDQLTPSIEEIATRGDLLDRALLLYLPMIPDARRMDEDHFWQTFERARPELLGAVLDAVSMALRQLPQTTLAQKPRMADFALWACAAASACGWTSAEFNQAYTGNREQAHDLTLEASPVGTVLRDMLTSSSTWQGTAQELLTELEQHASEQVRKQKAWPKNGRALSNTLRRLAPTLRAVGWTITFPSGSRKHSR